MNPFAEITIVLAVGLSAYVVARISRARHIARFGAPPPGSRVRTFAFFLAWSIAFIVLGLWSVSVLVATLVVLVVLSQLVGFSSRPWSWWQQFRDGGIFASLIVAPLTLLVLWYARG
jgi:hypothetical protein